MRDTSQAAYDNLTRNGVLPKRRREVYVHLYNHGPLTAGQVEEGLGKHAHKRLPELRDQGVVKELGEVPCPITGERAILWDVSSLIVPRALPPNMAGPTRKELLAELARLRDEVARLREELAKRPRQASLFPASP